MRKNKGIVKVSQEFIEEYPQEVLDMAFAGIFTVSVQISSWGWPEYYCYSDLFDPTEEGQVIPEYEIVVTQDEGKYSREIKRISND